MAKTMKYLLFLIIFLISCEKELVIPQLPECEDIAVIYHKSSGKYLAYWIPELDPWHKYNYAGIKVTGNTANGMCRRDLTTLQLSHEGKWSFFVSPGDSIMIDFDSIVEEDDFECITVVMP